MTVSAQFSVYPLEHERLGPAVEVLLRACGREGLEPRVGPMSTLVSGDAQRIFAALRAGFEEAAALGPTVLTVTISNACPAEGRSGSA
jgi:uncharacterized protein YqgV (UPF0045/DUF77 family)